MMKTPGKLKAKPMQKTPGKSKEKAKMPPPKQRQRRKRKKLSPPKARALPKAPEKLIIDAKEDGSTTVVVSSEKGASSSVVVDKKTDVVATDGVKSDPAAGKTTPRAGGGRQLLKPQGNGKGTQRKNLRKPVRRNSPAKGRGAVKARRGRKKPPPNRGAQGAPSIEEKTASEGDGGTLEISEEEEEERPKMSYSEWGRQLGAPPIMGQVSIGALFGVTAGALDGCGSGSGQVLLPRYGLAMGGSLLAMQLAEYNGMYSFPWNRCCCPGSCHSRWSTAAAAEAGEADQAETPDDFQQEDEEPPSEHCKKESVLFLKRNYRVLISFLMGYMLGRRIL